MVQKGQFLERPTLIPVGEGAEPVVMEGMSHRGAQRPPLLIIPPQPEFGSGMDHVVAAEVVWAAARKGFPTVRFNHRGVGGSQGLPGRGGALVEDAAAALQLVLENTGAAQAAVVAVASGAATAVALAERDPKVAGLCLVSPSVIDPEVLPQVKVPLLVVLGEEEDRARRGRWSQAAQEAGGTLELIPGTDASYRRNLPEVGRWAVHFLSSLSSR